MLYTDVRMLHNGVVIVQYGDRYLEADRGSQLYICHFGEEVCDPGHTFGPHVRDHYLIHYVAKGAGVLRCRDGREYAVGAGQGFLILPGEETTYQASEKNPWHYAWVGYCGTDAERITQAVGLDDAHRVFTAEDPVSVWRILHDLQSETHRMQLNQLIGIGNLLRFLCLIAPRPNASREETGKQYCKKAQWYLEGRYDRDVSIEETAAFAGVSRSHLFRVMKEEMGCSPKALLLRIRMERAAYLLIHTSLPMDEIAHRIGLRTGEQFGVCFRAFYGMTPGKYRALRHQDSQQAVGTPP